MFALDSDPTAWMITLMTLFGGPGPWTQVNDLTASGTNPLCSLGQTELVGDECR